MKRIISITAVILGLLTITTQMMKGQTSSLNIEKSYVEFKVSNIKVNSVSGTFKGMKGNVQFDPNNIQKARFDVCVDASTINTENKKRDDHLKTADYFDTEKYPNICFKSNAVTKTNLGYSTTGTLTLHGVSKVVTIPFVLKDKTLSGTFKINRLDYKVGDSGTFMVGNEVTLNIICLLP